MALRRSHDLLDAPLLQLSPYDVATIRDLCSGTLCTGMTGSGKSSGPAATILRSFVRAGMGGLITTAKSTDADWVRRICREEGRESSLIVWDGTNGGFNVLAWMLAQQGQDGVSNCIELLMRILEMKRAASTTPGGVGEQFWQDSVHQALRASIPVIFAATGTVRIGDILRFIRSAPTTPEQMRDPAWQRDSFFYACFVAARDVLLDTLAEGIIAYWMGDFGRLDQKTRGNIVISLTTMLDALTSGWLRRAFAEETTLVPELCFSGMIVVLDMPALTRHEDGVWAQQIFKYAFQRAVLFRGMLAPEHQQRPVFLMVDEFQLLCNSQDADFLSTCRSAQCCTVLLTQSLASIYARMPGPNAHDRAQQLVANCATKIWAANNCTTTNNWAADIIGKSVQQRGNFSASQNRSSSTGLNMGHGENQGTQGNWGTSFNYSSGPSGGSSGGGSSHGGGWSSGDNHNWGRNRGSSQGSGTSHGYSEQVDYLLRPDAFSRMLKTGGPAHGNRVSVVWHQASRIFHASRGNALLVEFQQ